MGKKGTVRIKQMGPKHPTPNPAMMMNPLESLMQPSPDEPVIQLPIQPDRSYKVFWPLHETFSMDPAKFQCIYPSYLDSTKTIAQGRRLPQSFAIPTPTVADLSSSLQVLQIRHVVQPYKGYSRDPTTLWDNPGRVMVDVSQHTKLQLMKLMAKQIPTLPSRIERLKREQIERELAELERQKQLQLQKSAAAASAASKAAPTTGKSTKKLKGKGGKKK